MKIDLLKKVKHLNIEDKVKFLGKNNISVNEKKYDALHFLFLSDNDKPVNEKKLNINESELNILKGFIKFIKTLAEGLTEDQKKALERDKGKLTTEEMLSRGLIK